MVKFLIDNCDRILCDYKHQYNIEMVLVQVFRTIYFRCQWWECYAYITSIASKARVPAFIGKTSCIDRTFEGFSSKWTRFVLIDGEKVEPDFLIVFNFEFKFLRHDSQNAWKIYIQSTIINHFTSQLLDLRLWTERGQKVWWCKQLYL